MKMLYSCLENRKASSGHSDFFVSEKQLREVVAVFPILADVVKVKKGSGSTAHWSIDSIRLSGWLRRCFTLLITLLDIDGIGQNWEDSNRSAIGPCARIFSLFPGHARHVQTLQNSRRPHWKPPCVELS